MIDVMPLPGEPLLLSALAFPDASAVLAWGSEDRDVMTTTLAGDGTALTRGPVLRGARDVAFAWTPSGGALLAWRAAGNGPTPLLARQVSPDGITGPVLPIAPASLTEPTIVSDRDGGAWLLWNTEASPPPGTVQHVSGLAVRHLGPDGTLGPVVELTATAAVPFPHVRADSAVDADGSVVVAWLQDDPGGGFIVRSRRVGPAGGAGPTVDVSPTQKSATSSEVVRFAAWDSEPAVTVQAGRATVAWLSEWPTATYFRRVTADAAMGPVRRLGTAARDVRLASAPDGTVTAILARPCRTPGRSAASRTAAGSCRTTGSVPRLVSRTLRQRSRSDRSAVRRPVPSCARACHSCTPRQPADHPHPT